jgi:hypothetical protein
MARLAQPVAWRVCAPRAVTAPRAQVVARPPAANQSARRRIGGGCGTGVLRGVHWARRRGPWAHHLVCRWRGGSGGGARWRRRRPVSRGGRRRPWPCSVAQGGWDVV